MAKIEAIALTKFNEFRSEFLPHSSYSLHTSVITIPRRGLGYGTGFFTATMHQHIHRNLYSTFKQNTVSYSFPSLRIFSTYPPATFGCNQVWNAAQRTPIRHQWDYWNKYNEYTKVHFENWVSKLPEEVEISVVQSNGD